MNSSQHYGLGWTLNGTNGAPTLFIDSGLEPTWPPISHSPNLSRWIAKPTLPWALPAHGTRAQLLPSSTPAMTTNSKHSPAPHLESLLRGFAICSNYRQVLIPEITVRLSFEVCRGDSASTCSAHLATGSFHPWGLLLGCPGHIGTPPPQPLPGPTMSQKPNDIEHD